MSQMGKFSLSNGGAPIETITPDAGAVVVPVAGNVNILGGNNISTFGVGDTLTIDLVGTTNHALQVGNATGSLTSLTVATNGQIPIGSTGADPVVANITAGAGIAIANGAGSITISSTDAGLGWTEINVGPVNLANNNGYIMNGGAVIVGTLPLTASVGDIIGIVGTGAGGWSIAQNLGQTIHFSSLSTTTGVAGSLSSTQRRDCVEIICVGADTDWVVRSSVGNLTVV